MAKILNRKQLVFQIKEMLYNTEEYIYIICPYIDLQQNEYLIKAFEHANNKKIDINVVYSKGYKKKSGQEALKKYEQVKLCYIADLHMKVYLNEKHAIVTSLNLHSYSVENNLECGVFINREEDLWRETYTMIKKDIYNNMIIEKKRPTAANSR